MPYGGGSSFSYRANLALMATEYRRWRFTILSACALTALLVVAAFVDTVGFGTTPWNGQAGVDLVASGSPYQQIVQSVDKGYAADLAGLRVGDLIDMRTNTALERWQWFNGFPTPIAGQTTTLSVTRGTSKLHVSIVAKPWDLRRYWAFWLGPAGMFFVVLIAALIAWRAEPSAANLSLSATLLSIGAGMLAWTNNFALPWLGAYVALAILTLLMPVAVALWVLHASTFATPVSRVRRIVAVLCYGVLAVICVCYAAETIAMTTLWLNPAGIYNFPIGLWALAVTLATACSALAIHSARGVERQRATWSLTALAAFFIINFAFTYLSNIASSYDVYAFENIVFNANFFTLPLILAYVALSRRLIDVGFVLNRAAVFTLVSAIVIGSFMAIEWALGSWLTAATHLTSSAIALAIAMVLGLSLRFIHQYVDRFVDRVFFRKRHEDEAALRRFAHECSYITDAPTLAKRAVNTVTRHTSCESVVIVYPKVDVDENDPALISLHAWGKPLDLHGVPESVIQGEYAFPMIARGTLVGALVCGRKANGESLAPDELDALAALSHGVGIALDALANKGSDSVDFLRHALAEMRDAILLELRTKLS